MALIHPSSVITPVSYEFAQLDPPSAGTDGHYVYFEESDEDAFILPNKEYGLDFVIEAIDAVSVTFGSAASTKSGAVAGDTIISVSAPGASDQKAGSRFWLKTAAATFTDAQAVGDVVTGYTEIVPGEVVHGVTNGHYGIVIITDADGRIYAKSTAATITSKTSG